LDEIKTEKLLCAVACYHAQQEHIPDTGKTHRHESHRYSRPTAFF